MKSLLITHPDCGLHSLAGHAECPERLTSVISSLQRSGVIDDMHQQLAMPATDVQLQLAHPASFVAQIAASEPAEGLIMLDADTYMHSGSLRAARLAAGACHEATAQVLSGAADRVFCAIRPPGHHAEIAAAMGFCFFNSVAVGARLALTQLARVAILDFDVHHCNGTVDIFKDDPRVLVCSSFQADYYPNRYLDFDNEHIINTPLAAGTRSAEFRRLIETQWQPAIERHKPELIFISAGFDAHRADPLAQIELATDDYGWITGFIADMARRYSQGRIVSTLEGGYDLAALGDSARLHVETLVSAAGS